MKLTKRIKQLLFGLAWGDVLATVIALLLNKELGIKFAIGSIVVVFGIIVVALFWASYTVIVGED